MAEVRKITIEILTKNESSSQESTDSSKQSNLTDKLKKDNKSIKNKENALLGSSVLLNQAYQNAKRMISQTVSSSVDAYFAQSENYIGQNTYAQVNAIVKKSTGFLSSTIQGAGTGAKVAGPWGAAVGAVIGAVSFSASDYIQKQRKMSSYYSSLNATNMQTQFLNTRASLYNNGKGTEN